MGVVCVTGTEDLKPLDGDGVICVSRLRAGWGDNVVVLYSKDLKRGGGEVVWVGDVLRESADGEGTPSCTACEGDREPDGGFIVKSGTRVHDCNGYAYMGATLPSLYMFVKMGL